MSRILNSASTSKQNKMEKRKKNRELVTGIATLLKNFVATNAIYTDNAQVSPGHPKQQKPYFFRGFFLKIVLYASKSTPAELTPKLVLLKEVQLDQISPDMSVSSK